MDIEKLLGIKPRQPEEQSYMHQADEDMRERQDNDLVAMKKAQDESNIAFNTTLITPDRLIDSEIHQLLTKDFGMTNFKKTEAELLITGFSLLEDFLVLTLKVPAVNLHAELQATCLAYGSVEGFSRRELNTTTIGRKYERDAPGSTPMMRV